MASTVTAIHSGWDCTGGSLNSLEYDSVYYQWTHLLCKRGKNRTKLFLPDRPIPVLSQFISWIILDLGIEVCFFDGMSACSKAWLQYVFPIYIWLILTLIVIFARFSKQLLRLVGSHIVPVLSTLLLLSYTKLIHNVIQALYVSRLTCVSETLTNEHSVWYFNGNIAYFSGCHLPLLIAALLVLTFIIVPYTLFLLTSPVLEAIMGKKMFRWVLRLKPVMDAYGGPYNDKFRVWTGFLLLVRVILALLTSLSDSKFVSVSALICTMVILITIHCIAHEVYNKWYLNALEVTFLLNLVLLCYFADANRENKDRATIVLLSISLITFLSIVLYHIILRINPGITVKKVFTFKKTSNYSTIEGDAINSVHAKIIYSTNSMRESLLGADFVEFVGEN